jgi:hypothetical protein
VSACPHCGDTVTLRGGMPGHGGHYLPAAMPYAPPGRAVLLAVHPDDGMIRACTACGLVWGRLDAQALRELLHGASADPAAVQARRAPPCAACGSRDTVGGRVTGSDGTFRPFQLRYGSEHESVLILRTPGLGELFACRDCGLAWCHVNALALRDLLDTAASDELMEDLRMRATRAPRP